MNLGLNNLRQLQNLRSVRQARRQLTRHGHGKETQTYALVANPKLWGPQDQRSSVDGLSSTLHGPIFGLLAAQCPERHVPKAEKRRHVLSAPHKE